MASVKKTSDRAVLINLGIAAVLIVLAIMTALAINRKMEKRVYSLSYGELIEKYAGQYDLDPYLVAAVIHVESGNCPDAVSGVGAVGLMQVMPSTGAWIAGKLNIEFEEEDLKDPETNIEMGCWYLRFLFDRFAEKDTVIAAYNAGHNRIAQWLADERYSEDGDNLFHIPYEETRNYVERVQRAYDKYKRLYPNEFPD